MANWFSKVTKSFFGKAETSPRLDFGGQWYGQVNRRLYRLLRHRHVSLKCTRAKRRFGLFSFLEWRFGVRLTSYKKERIFCSGLTLVFLKIGGCVGGWEGGGEGRCLFVACLHACGWVVGWVCCVCAHARCSVFFAVCSQLFINQHNAHTAQYTHHTYMHTQTQ